MKTHILAILLLAGFTSSFSHAETSDWNQNYPVKSTTQFHESDMALPNFPNPQSGNWFNLYINETLLHQMAACATYSTNALAQDTTT